MGVFIRAAALGEIGDHDGKVIRHGKRNIAVMRVGERYFAIDNECTHVGAPLHEGVVAGEEVICPWHAARFCLKTGRALCGPARYDLRTYRVRVNGNQVEVEVAEEVEQHL